MEEIRSKTKNRPRAIADLGKAIELKADYAYAYLNRGMIYKKLGQRNKAIIDLRRTIELGTNRSWSERAKEHLRELGESPRDTKNDPER